MDSWITQKIISANLLHDAFGFGRFLSLLKKEYKKPNFLIYSANI